MAPFILLAFFARGFFPALVNQLLHEIAALRHGTRYNGLRPSKRFASPVAITVAVRDQER